MHITYQTLWLPKAGNSPEEYEDAYAPDPDAVDGASSKDFLCAIADGATETSFSGLWAQRLARAYAERRMGRITPALLRELAGEWNSAITERTREKPLPWYAEEKLQKGAFAAFAGLHLRADGWWTGLAVGDCCVFQLRPGAWIKSFPYGVPEVFNNSPTLWSTNAARNTQIVPNRVRGRWKTGDYFLLMSDAVACAFLAHEDFRRQFHGDLDAESFEALIEAARHDHLIKNDDVTVLKIIPSMRPGSGGVA